VGVPAKMGRRTFLAGLAGSAGGGSRLAWGQPPGDSADSWTQFRRDSLLTGVTVGTLPPTLRELWSYEAGEAIDSSAAIAARRV
jgi:hypothetical protein